MNTVARGAHAFWCLILVALVPEFLFRLTGDLFYFHPTRVMLDAAPLWLAYRDGLPWLRRR